MIIAKSAASVAATAALLAVTTTVIVSPVQAAKMVHCFGVNNCKGQSDCKSGNHACKGMNSCKGQGFKAESKKQCKADHGSLTPPAATPSAM
ncbi:MAG: hypothetical protein KGQ42_06810 [Alphaproteobacteria bacterium]|nr:hypothetical protein [Alphaproteobacteria bacterium]MDE2041608.1 hypothetical protein [Alphaproteobacteria bacterium]MDE2339778.1 hypothetical protein [Alphaproteobacteria bacterium]